MKTVLLGITSGIAAYKSLELIKLLKQQHMNVVAIMTEHATRMLPPHEVEQATGNTVYTQLFEEDFNYKDILKKRHVDHIDLADNADMLVIAPATANVIAKLAHGIADDFLTTAALAMTKPILICPTMNVHMWENSIVQENILKLKNHGYQVLEPATGMLACGYEGVGRLPDVATIRDMIVKTMNKNESLKGRKIIVSAGGTIEPIDDVRYIANRSSGKMGIAIAEACFKRGADVLLLRSKHAVSSYLPLKQETFQTAAELLELITRYAKDYDTIYHAAAVSDFTVVNKHIGKLSSDQSLSLELQPQKKIVDQIKKINPHIQLIAFKAEYGLSETELIEKAKDKLKKSNADMVVANDIGKPNRGFESDMNEVILVNKQGILKKTPYASKKEIADQIVDVTQPLEGE